MFRGRLLPDPLLVVIACFVLIALFCFCPLLHIVCSCCTSRRLKVSGFCSAFFGLALLLVALFVPPAIRTRLDDGIHDFVSLAPDAMEQQTEGFRTWANYADPDALPVYASVYMFNITSGRTMTPTHTHPTNERTNAEAAQIRSEWGMEENKITFSLASPFVT